MTTRPNYSGARPSNAGDDFHELWVLREALRLLEHGTDLRGITVEGLGVEDEVGMPTGTFDGVDCTFYYGGDDAASSKLIVIDQVKYSTINPNEPWTSARLTRSTNKKRDNSVIGRLAKVFVGIKQILADQLTTDRLKIRLISNQPIDESFLSALRGDEEEGSLQKLLEASGLNQKDFDAFRKHLDFSYCGAGSRLELERQIHLAIYRWTDEETQAIVEHLRFCVRNMMMPEKEGEIITRNKVLLWMKVSDPSALFPCPPVIEHVENRISRKVSTVIAEKLQNGEQFICLHGEAGCGKTTALREVEEKLPTGSVVLLFDCYGGGRYLDAVAYRHRPKDAFLELSNDLASALRMPFLLTRSSEINYPKAFLKRLQMASDSLSAYASNALLVVIIDAADNSITAASKQAPPERSFVQDFVHMGELPKNVRFVLTCRTGRLNSLDLPRKFEPIPMKNFDREETAIFVRSTWQNASDAWIDDFHHLSAGNPRVQRYAIDFARLESVNALDYLRPDGKALDQIFNDRFESALRKQGTDFDLRKVCAGLVVLPRPIPIRYLSGVAGIEIENVRDICRDLAPGVRLIEDEVGFADEDFEEFVRREASSEFVAMQGRIAEYFLGLYESEPYAAVHVAAALFEAGRAGEIVQLVKDQREPRIIGDPVLRREVQLKRLRIAMKVSRQMGNNVDALMTLLVGAEALKTDAALQKMFIENPDLVASFARDTASRDILRDPELIENHGSFLFQMMVSDARRGDKISVREGSRQLHAWLAKRKEVTNEEEKNHPGFGMIDWKIKEDDIAAQTEAVLRVAGLQAALNNLSRWRPRTLAIRVARILCDRLLASGDDKFLRECIAKGYVQSPWDLFILTPLALYGVDVDISLLETSIECLVRHGRLKISNELDDFQHGSNPRADYLETVLTACELVIARGGKRKAVIAALKLISDPSVRRRQRGFVANTPTIDLSLRAFALLENLRGRKLTLEKYWLDPLPSNKGLSKEEREKREKDDNEIKEEIRNFIGPIVGIYNVRALSIAGRIASSQVEEKLKEAIAHFQSEHYRFSRRYNAGAMSTLVALAISRLMVISRLDRSKVLSWAIMCLGEWSSALGDGQTRILARFCIEPSLHTLILENVLGLANTIEKFKTSAEQKIEAMVHLARLVLPISSRDAQALFNKAVDIAGELNVDAIHEVGVFLPLADRAADTMNIDQKREKAASIARVVSDAAIRLEGQEGFPWEEAGGSLAALDIGIALSAVARWEDSGIASRHQVLPSAFIKGLQHGTLSSSQVAGLLPLVEESDSGLINTILQCAGQTVSKKGLDAFVEEIARDQVLRTKDFPFAYLYEKLREVNHEGQDHFWMNKLRQSEQFFRERVSPVLANSQSNKKVCDTAERRAKAAELIESINWGESRFVSTEEIGKMLQAVSDKAREVDQYVDLSGVLDRMSLAVAVADRSLHLDALARLDFAGLGSYEFRSLLVKRLEEWNSTPAVQQWCRQELLRILGDRLPLFALEYTRGRSVLSILLDLTEASNEDILGCLLDGIQNNVDEFEASWIYKIVGFAAKYCSQDDAATLVAEYTNRLLQRIPATEREEWILDDIPTSSSCAIARMLYAYMSDVDVRIRWKAAHCLRRLVRLGDIEVVNTSISLYSKTKEQSFRDPSTPFYWLAARLWLMIAMCRISHESPKTLVRCHSFLLKVALDASFPHVLVRAFAKEGILQLVEGGHVKLPRAEMDKLRKVNVSAIRRKSSKKQLSLGSDRSDTKRDKHAFEFDSLDTLPYWYSTTLSIFANVTMEDFLDVADKWISERWGVKGNTRRWSAEPRHNRFANSYPLESHSHGARPTLERYHTYLEWHAMFFTVGELMRTKALVPNDDRHFQTFENWLKNEKLAATPFWLSDFRLPKPFEMRFWCGPNGDLDLWVEQVDTNDFLTELKVDGRWDRLVVDSYHNTRSSNFKLTAYVKSALVSPELATSLLRALQTVEYASDYGLPSSGSDAEIHEPPFRLVGWLDDLQSRSGIDERDPFRNGIQEPDCYPSASTSKLLKLTLNQDHETKWIHTRDRKIFFSFESWSEFSDFEDDEKYRFDETVHSSGHSLIVSQQALMQFLNKKGLDLIVKVEIERRNKGYESRYDPEKVLEVTFDRVFILRQNGKIETAEGYFGTWAVSSS